MIETMSVKWRLKEVLTRHEVTPYELSKLTKGRLSRTSVYGLATTDSPKHVQLESLDAIIDAMATLGHEVTFNDLFERQRDMTPLFDTTSGGAA
jgi:hypothetical protein